MFGQVPCLHRYCLYWRSLLSGFILVKAIRALPMALRAPLFSSCCGFRTRASSFYTVPSLRKFIVVARARRQNLRPSQFHPMLYVSSGIALTCIYFLRVKNVLQAFAYALLQIELCVNDLQSGIIISMPVIMMPMSLNQKAA